MALATQKKPMGLAEKRRVRTLYNQLLSACGPQGWWPLLGVKGTNPTKTGSHQGYHPGDYSYPKTQSQRFEICAGAILAQSTAWPNAEKALINLQKAKALDPKAMAAMDVRKLGAFVRPAGYFNQKARKLKAFAEFFLGLDGRTPGRSELLALWGVGPETADSILLYAYQQPEFVVDAYTKRIGSARGWFAPDASYDSVKAFFRAALKPDYRVYQEYHALLVEHAKRNGKTKRKSLKFNPTARPAARTTPAPGFPSSRPIRPRARA